MTTMGIKVAIVTGANSGLGFEVTWKLCGAGYRVILACRNEKLAQEAMQNIQKSLPQAEMDFIKLDLSDLSSVKAFADDFLKKDLPLNVLVNNAGVFFSLRDTNRHVTKEGYEMTMASNHIGHFLLTHLLLEKLKVTANEQGEARVVVISSELHDGSLPGHRYAGRPIQPLDMDNIMLEQPNTYFGSQAYKNSKLANILFAQELSTRLEGTGVSVTSMSPGFIPRTGLSRHAGKGAQFFIRYILDGLCKPCNGGLTRTTDQGATEIFQLAADPKYKGVTGKYFQLGEETEPSSEAHDKSLQQRVWDWTYLKVEPYLKTD